RDRAWQPPSALHPTFTVDGPLRFELVDAATGVSRGGCTYHVSHPGGRASYVDLAAAVGLSAAGARRRVVRLIDARVVRIGAVVRHSGQDRQSAMGFGIRLTGHHHDVVAALTDMPAVIFVARTLGRFDILMTVRAFSAAQLVELMDTVRALPGVRALESWAHLDVVKESYASGLNAVTRP
ncbi:Lrp/AsnC family transcriptional regulator, partial [Mycobacterium sp. NAZ190054]|uniref:Lrp/AsnC family transcriptional regulator n=1 Tax=Mycobacterium sp. NAZ190054 TaxID=1747766 RepID=UPI000A516E16